VSNISRTTVPTRRSSTPEAYTFRWIEPIHIACRSCYTSLIADSHVASDAAADGSEPMLVEFTLAGVPYTILNGGPHYALTPVL
jgi:hypothetical protein